jgi:RNA polymerase sigma factor (sigma-70 family)
MLGGDTHPVLGDAVEPTDEALLQACRGGDASAWEALIARYQRLIYAICRQTGLNPEQSADVFQSVFTALLQQLDRIEQPALLGSWITTTARRQSWALVRRKSAMEQSLGDDTLQANTLSDPAPLPDEIVLRQEQQHSVRIALLALDERCHTLLTLLFYRANPAPYDEIATTLGIRVGGIGPTRARCLQKLRLLLGDRIT